MRNIIGFLFIFSATSMIPKNIWSSCMSDAHKKKNNENILHNEKEKIFELLNKEDQKYLQDQLRKYNITEQYNITFAIYNMMKSFTNETNIEQYLNTQQISLNDLKYIINVRIHQYY